MLLFTYMFFLSICMLRSQNLGEFYYAFYVLFVTLFVFILWNTLKMVTGVTET